MTYRNKTLLDAARHYPCQRCGNPFSVAAHSNSIRHRGASHKAPDFMVAYLCAYCHDLTDGRQGGLTKDEKREMWGLAWEKTVAIWFRDGWLEVKKGEPR